MAELDWNKTDLEILFAVDATRRPADNGDDWLFAYSDGVLRCEALILPGRSAICLTIFLCATDAIVADLAFIARAPLQVRKQHGPETLYCHECLVAPGANSYRSLEWYSYYDYITEGGKAVSVELQLFPSIAIRLFDTAPENGAGQ